MKTCANCGEDFTPRKDREHTSTVCSRSCQLALFVQKGTTTAAATAKAKRHAGDTEKMTWTTLRRRVIEEQDGYCKHCDLNEWMGQPMPLTVNHIDGDRSNNKRDNLEAICPNCHMLTPTFCGRNIKDKHACAAKGRAARKAKRDAAALAQYEADC
jgi:hypothetical protein